MNESNQSVHHQPDITPPVEAVTPVTPPITTPQQPTPTGSQTMALWSLILGIVSVALVILLPISVPAAIVAVVLGIIVLTKHRLGKGKALAGIITGALTLIIAGPLFALVIVAWNGVSERANENYHNSMQHEASSQEMSTLTKPDATNKTTVDTDCYTYDIPSGYEYDTASSGCTTATNIPNGDSLSRVVVKPNTGTIGTLSDVVALFNKSLKNSNPNSDGVIDQKEFTSNGETVYYVTYKDSYDLLYGNYIIPKNTTLKDNNGTTITAYTVAGYANLPQLKEVLDSLTTK